MHIYIYTYTYLHIYTFTYMSILLVSEQVSCIGLSDKFLWQVSCIRISCNFFCRCIRLFLCISRAQFHTTQHAWPVPQIMSRLFFFFRGYVGFFYSIAHTALLGYIWCIYHLGMYGVYIIWYISAREASAAEREGVLCEARALRRQVPSLKSQLHSHFQ